MLRARSLAAAIGLVLLVLSFLGSTPAAAGGYAFKAHVLDLRVVGNDEYRLAIVANLMETMPGRRNS
jgi:hypothetical protein